MMLNTKRLCIRHLTVDDAEFILGLLNEPSFLQFIGDKGVRTLDDSRNYLRTGPLASYKEHGFGLNLTLLADMKTPIGICGLLKRDTLDDVDLGFAFRPQFWRRGYAAEAAAAVLEHGKEEFGFRRIVAVTSPDNEGSAAVLLKLGFRFERMVQLSGEASEVKLFAFVTGV